MAFELGCLDHSGIATITSFDERYPPQLVTGIGSKASPILRAAGTLDLLDSSGSWRCGKPQSEREGAPRPRRSTRLWFTLGRGFFNRR